MATSWSSAYTFNGKSTKSHGSYNATMECECGWMWKNDEDNTAIQYATYSRARYSSANATGYGVRTRVYIGSELGTTTGVLNYGTWVADTGWKYSSWIPRTHETQYVEIWAKANGETVSGYGAAPEDTGWFKYTDYIGPLASWTVSYDANGGSGAPASQTKWLGETLALQSPTPSWEGRTFNGWNTKADGTGTNYAAGASYTGNEALTLYAKWTLNTYQVTFDANGGLGAPATQTKTHGVNLTISATKPTRTNYKFLGWATSASATSAQYRTGTNNDQNVTYTTDAPITLYAVWELAYVAPRITNLKCYRCDDSGTAADEGTRCYVSFTYTTDTNISSTNYATVTAKVGSNTATTLVAASAHKMGTNTYAGVLSDTGLDVNSTYSVAITVTDAQNGSTTSSTVLSQAFFTLDVLAEGHGIAIGKPASTPNLLDVGMASKFTDVTLTGTLTLPSQSAGTALMAPPSASGVPTFRKLDVGGRNLLACTISPKYLGRMNDKTTIVGAGGWGKWTATEHTYERTDDGIKLTYGSSSTMDGIVIPLSYRGAVVGGETYTLSFMYRGTITTLGYLYLLLDGGTNVYKSGISITSSASDWSRFTWTGQWPSTSYPAVGIIVPYTNGSGKWIEFKDGSMKLERGIVATDWTPAPEDKLNVPTVLYNNASGTNGTVTLSQTAANFDHMRIYATSSYGDVSVDVYSPDGKEFTMTAVSTDNSGMTTVYFIQQRRATSGTSITVHDNGYAYFDSSSQSVSATAYMKVVRVEAWNES